MAFLLLVACIVLAIAALPIVKLARRYNEARLIGLPVVIDLVDQSSLIWKNFGDRFKPFLKRLPFRIGHYVGFRYFFHDRYRLHELIGPIYTVAAPDGITAPYFPFETTRSLNIMTGTYSQSTRIVVADADVADDVLTRYKDFIKPKSMYEALELFGPNVDTVNGKVWQRQRRLTTPPFNERNSSLVWRESIIQAKDMMRFWTSVGGDGISKTTSDTMTLALHVLTAAGFGKPYDFEGGVTKLTGDHKLSYKDSLRLILRNFGVAFLIETKQPTTSVPRSMIAGISTAIKDFKQYMEEMIDEERAKIGTAQANDNLMSVLVHASESEAQGIERAGLTREEMLGNLFIYNLAGHDTTANTIGYAIYLMASKPEWQVWIREELDFVFGGDDASEDDYEKAFPKLKRCLAAMYETLRLYGPVVVIPKATADTIIEIVSNGKTYSIPRNTNVLVNVNGLNTSPHYWGPDALTWRPDRWIHNSGKTKSMADEEMMQAPKGRFLSWASGPRICPGKKFSQVEFVAVMATLFRRLRVVPVINEGESEEDVKKRILETVEDSKIVMTLAMKHPERVKLIWEEG
ncbi:hypothetical protein VTL71DRAFT_8448 [Oculimacula yallundae]|uniref:Cytochrome P450 n=1 Tax=Oculimacula yallundae TaxID=86028 RepID=A0ABR4CXN2_9HELO